MTKIQFHDRVINTVYIPYITNYTRIQIFYGGSSSGKSVFAAQRCVLDILNGGRNYLVCRKVARTIRRSVFNEIEKVIADWGVKQLFAVNHAELLVTCTNGYQILFAGLDDVEKIKSITPAKGVITDIWVEEATELERNDLKQLIKRQRGGDAATPKRLTMTFNPILKSHWLFSDYFSKIGWEDAQTEFHNDRLSILKTWYIHNRFLTDDDIQDLEDENDKYYHDVYTLGNWGVIGHVIFTNWRVEDLSGMREQFVNRRNGLDFGFSSDPAALSRSHYDRTHKKIYVFDEIYETGLTNPQLAGLLKPMCGEDRIICDSAEPKSIQELKDNGIKAVPAKKGQDSVNFGIQWLQQQTIIIDKSCIHSQNEMIQYKWKEDRQGNAIRQPVDHNNHFIDATRYAYEEDALVKREARQHQG